MKKIKSKLVSMLVRAWNDMVFSGEAKEWIEKKTQDVRFNKKESSDGILLFDLPNVTNQLVENLAASKYFSSKLSLTPKYYQPNLNLNTRSIVVRLLARAVSCYTKAPRFARKVGAARGIDACYVNQSDIAKSKALSQLIKIRIKTKSDLANLEVDGVKIGRAVYDTFLRVQQVGTIDLGHPLLMRLLDEAILIMVAADRYFSNNPVKIVILGHCVYINWQIISDVALRHGADVFVTFNSRSPPFHHVNSNRGLQTADHTTYRSRFLLLCEKERVEALGQGKQLIERRLSGVLDDGISYMASSPYQSGVALREPDADERKTLVFMLHCFSDSPHIYKDMLFSDFLEWLTASLDYIKQKDLFRKYRIYLKPHPNRFAHEDKIIYGILDQYPFAERLDPAINNKSLAASRPAAIVSVYGTVAAEFTILNVPVILCGDNPASAYKFAYQAETIDEYFKLLEGAEDLRVERNIELEVYEFLYMHYIYHRRIDLLDFPFKPRKSIARSSGSGCRYKDFQYDHYAKLIDRFLERTNIPPEISL